MLTKILLGKEWDVSLEGVSFAIAHIKGQSGEQVVPFRSIEELIYLVDNGIMLTVVRLLTPRQVWKSASLSLDNIVNYRDKNDYWKVVFKDPNAIFGYAIQHLDLNVVSRPVVDHSLNYIKQKSNILVRLYKPVTMSDKEYEVLSGLNMLCNIYIHMSASRDMELVYKLYTKAKREFIKTLGLDRKKIKEFEQEEKMIYDVRSVYERS